MKILKVCQISTVNLYLIYRWGEMKENIYKIPVQSRADLENRVRHEFNHLNGDEIQRATVHNVMESIQGCLIVNGDHF